MSTRREHYGFEKTERELRDRLRARALALADRGAGSRDYAEAVAAFVRGREELARAREARIRERLRRQAAGKRPAPWDSPRALERRRIARAVAEARWTDWADRTVLAARAGAPPPPAPGERGRAG
ncbi:MAG: hypothetical protein IJV65_02130, partial [Kiritimatiellae bacterium]|nr:hypothetical protein [Kiritimatiellia bacterium]